MVCKSLTAPDSGSDKGILITGNVAAQSNPSNPTIRITGGTITGPITITGSLLGKIQYDTAGTLANQVIVNAANSTGAWTGPVAIDGTTLVYTGTQPYQAPYYNLGESSLGGGAVGLAPFHLHEADCTPPNNSNLSSIPANFITLRFYGPVTWGNAEMPVKVECGAATYPSMPSTSSDVSDEFDFSTCDLDHPGRDLDITPIDPDNHFARHMAYRLTPLDGKINCAGLTAAGDVPVASFTYVVWVTY